MMKNNNETYKVDYEAAERMHPMGINGGRIVRLWCWKQGQMMLHYEHGEWIKPAADAEARMILRRITERVH